MQQRAVMFWNLGRMFGSSGSPIEHALTIDDAKATATEAQVRRKAEVIASSIEQAARTHGAPLIVGFAEIESSELAAAIADRVQCVKLVDIDSVADDETIFALDGLNISVLLDPMVFTGPHALRSHLVDTAFGTRDILEADLTFSAGTDFLSLFVNHWPSRLSSDGVARRTAAAHYLARLIEGKVRFSLAEMWNAEYQKMDVPTSPEVLRRARRPVIVMGDFNDEVFDHSLGILNTTPETEVVIDDLRLKGRSDRERFRTYRASDIRLLDPFWAYVGRGGSYYRSPRWRTYDQILFSRGAIEQSSGAYLCYVEGSAAIQDSKSIGLRDGSKFTLTNRNGKPIMFEPENDRGCSDHFPVIASVELPDVAD